MGGFYDIINKYVVEPQGFMPIILATLEAEIRRITVAGE
jgi:hypothetical protein